MGASRSSGGNKTLDLRPELLSAISNAPPISGGLCPHFNCEGFASFPRGLEFSACAPAAHRFAGRYHAFAVVTPALFQSATTNEIQKV